MCRELDLMRAAQALRLDAEKTACRVCSFRPRDGQPAQCGYLRQKGKRADIWIGAHNMLFSRKPAAIGDLAAVIVDENPIGAALEGVEGAPIRLCIDTLRRIDKT